MDHPLGVSGQQTEFIRQHILNTAGNLAGKTFAELTETAQNVSYSLRREASQLLVNCASYSRYALNRHYLNPLPATDSQSSLAELGQLPGVAGLIFQRYCGGGRGRPAYFSDENGQRIDAIRRQIQQWKEQAVVAEGTYYFLLASLLESAVRIANVSPANGLPPKTFRKAARQPLVLKAAPSESVPREKKREARVYRENITDLIGRIQGDVLYLDLLARPVLSHPYNQLLEDLALYDVFDTREKMEAPEESQPAFFQSEKLLRSFEDWINRADFQYVFVRSNDGSAVTALQMKEIMARYGDYDAVGQEFAGKHKQPVTALLHTLRKEKYALRHQFGKGQSHG